MTVILVKFLKHGVPTGKHYPYKTSLEVQEGQVVMISEKVKGVVVGFAPYTLEELEGLKEIYGLPKVEEVEGNLDSI